MRLWPTGRYPANPGLLASVSGASYSGLHLNSRTSSSVLAPPVTSNSRPVEANTKTRRRFFEYFLWKKSILKIIIVDDHPLFIEGIRNILGRLEETVEIITSGSCEEAIELTETDDDFDLLLLDLNLPGISGLDGMQRLRHQMPATPIVLLSASEDRGTILRAIEQGAKGFISKSAEAKVIISALRLVLSGGVYLPMAILDSVNATQEMTGNAQGQKLTPRQFDVLKLIALGHPNKIIARHLNMAENTVRVHVSAILRFLEVSNRTEAGIAANKMGILSED